MLIDGCSMSGIAGNGCSGCSMSKNKGGETAMLVCWCCGSGVAACIGVCSRFLLGSGRPWAGGGRPWAGGVRGIRIRVSIALPCPLDSRSMSPFSCNFPMALPTVLSCSPVRSAMVWLLGQHSLRKFAKLPRVARIRRSIGLMPWVALSAACVRVKPLALIAIDDMIDNLV